MAYKAGTLDVDFRGIDAGATQSITNVVTALRKLRRIDYEKIATGFSNMTTAIDPFITKIKSAEASLTAMYGILSKISGKKIQSLLDYSGGYSRKSGKKLIGSRDIKSPRDEMIQSLLNYRNKNKGSFSAFFSRATWLTSIYFARRLGGYVQSIAQSGADYTETLNLWEVAMGNNLVLAEEFVKKMNTAYGISEKTLMNAQATFKNMLGSLGQISDATAYRLSEGVTQMAIDYASLYNVQFEKAFEKFQAALAGQVRPIRSVSGYDITENTLYQLYQSLGGTKSVRNLSRTEKQLLSILAIFNQMERSGAIGDLDKTINSFANQSRILAESWSEFKTYLGITLTYLIQESGILTKISGTLMFLSDVFKAYAESVGAIQHFGDPFEPVTDGAENAYDAVNELTGKLLDFDKFRALSSSEDSGLGLDEKLLDAFGNYDTILANATNEAREFADTLKALSGFFNKDGSFDLDKFNDSLTLLESLLSGVLVVMASVFGAKMTREIASFSLVFVKNFQEMRLQSALATTALQKFQLGASTLFAGITALAGGIMALATAWDEMKSWEIAITIFVSLAAAIGAAAAAFYAFKQNWAMAIGVGAMVAGTGLTIGSTLATVTDYAEGGLPDKGTVFRAGEAGAEIVYNTPSGQSGVANVQQIAQAQLSALNSWWKTARNDIPVFEGVSESGLYTVVDGEASRRGLGFAKR